MSTPGSKRKVMGRIDLAQDSNSSSSPRPVRGTSSPIVASSSNSLSPPTSRPVSSSGSLISKSKGHVRAKVDMSSFSGMTNTSTSSSSPLANSPNFAGSTNPSTPKNQNINGRLSPSISVNGTPTSVASNNRASPSTFVNQNSNPRSGVRSKVRNNSEDLSSSSGSSGFTNVSSNPNGIISPKMGSHTISGGIRGHSRSITSSHVSSIFPSPSSSSNVNSVNPGRTGAKVAIKPISRSRTPSPVRNERPNLNRFGSNISSSNSNNIRFANAAVGSQPSSPKKEFNPNIFQAASTSKGNLAPAYETPLTSPEQAQNTTRSNPNGGLNRSNSVSNASNVSHSSPHVHPIQSTSNFSTPATSTKSGVHPHPYGRAPTATSSNRPFNLNLNDSTPQSRGLVASDDVISPTFKSTLTNPTSNPSASSQSFPFQSSNATMNRNAMERQNSSASSSLLSPILDPSNNVNLNLNLNLTNGNNSPSGASTSTSTFTSTLSPKEEAEAKEAKKNRKILDLEITNKSLLAINAGLEATKLKQAREIRELKRKFRLSLVATNGTGNGIANLDDLLGKKKKKKAKKKTKQPGENGDGDDGEFFQDAYEFDDDDDDDDEDDEDDEFDEDDEEDEDEDEDEEGELNPELEQSHTKCKNLIDQMVSNARKCILEKFHFDEDLLFDPKENLGPGGGGTKVLHPLELELIEEEKRKNREEQERGKEDNTSERIRLGDETGSLSTIAVDQSRTEIQKSSRMDSTFDQSSLDQDQDQTDEDDFRNGPEKEIETQGSSNGIGFPTSSSNLLDVKEIADGIENQDEISEDGSQETSIATKQHQEEIEFQSRPENDAVQHPDASID